MKLITRDTDYALRAACFIAKQNSKIVPVSRMIKELKMPGPFLRKILQILNRKGILKSHKGQGGGFSLGVPPERIYLVKLAEIFQGPLKLNDFIEGLIIEYNSIVFILYNIFDSFRDNDFTIQ